MINEAIFSIACFMVFIKPIRTRIQSIAIAFSSFDRPEDRPYTLLWYMSQLVVGYLILYPAIIIYDHYHMMALLNIQVLIGVFGDGLAEPIGIRFGKHKYTTHSIFSKREYARSIEGSMAIFIVSIIVLFIFRHAFDRIQFFIALATIPFAMTLAEAFSPHTWDDPLMISVGSLLIFLIKKFF
jgi:dolichol kinase